jgi:RND family efflux transporter MFP subunit
MAMAEKQLGMTQVRAPFSGIVGDRTVSAGDVVQPGIPMFTVVDPSTMRLEASLPAEALKNVRIGASVRFTVTGYEGRSFTGRVSRISPSADPITRQVKIVVSVPATGDLVSGLFAEGRVATESRTVPSVPLNSVDRRGLEPFVLRIRGGKVEKVVVELGTVDDVAERVEIARGVTVGDTLLLGTAQGIAPGTTIAVTGPADTTVRR